MAAYEIDRSAKMPPLSCSVCGSVWFRWETFRSSDPQIRLEAPLLVCLCGTVVTPRLSGARGSRPPSEQLEIDRLYAALANVRSRCLAITDAAALAAVAVGDTATLTSEIARLERSCERLRQRLLPASAAVTRARPPRRPAATHGLDKLALDLQRAQCSKHWCPPRPAGKETVQVALAQLDFFAHASAKAHLHLRLRSEISWVRAPP